MPDPRSADLPTGGFPGLARSLLPQLPWQDDLAAAAATAVAEQRPVLLLCGQALDHWSTRWLREIAADAEVGALLAGFALVAVDAEQSPAATALAQQMLALQGAAGWPCVAILTPQLDPLGALPYAPLRDGGGRVGVARILIEVLEAWQADPAGAIAMGRSQVRQLAGLGAPAPALARNDDLTREAAEAAAIELADRLEGGFGGTPRHLQPGLWWLLLERCARGLASPQAVDHLERSCQALCAGAIHDQLGGGFFRACADAKWEQPFSELRAGDQALAALLLLRSSAALATPLYGAVAMRALERACAWQRADGLIGHGLHADSLGADGQPVSGAAYAWNHAGVAALVGAEGAQLFAERYLTGAEVAPSFRVPALRASLDGAAGERLPAIVARLAAARSERPQPAADPRALAWEQGALLTALVQARSGADSADEGPLAAAATRLAAALRQVSALPAAWDADGRPLGQAGLADLAWCAWGLAAWAALSGDGEAARCAARYADAAYASGDATRLWPLEPAHTRLGSLSLLAGLDTPDAPAPAAVLVQALRAVEDLAPGSGRAAAAQAIIDAHRGWMQRAPAACAALVAAW